MKQLLFLVFLLPGLLSAQTRLKSITVKGRVTTINNQSVPMVRVEIMQNGRLVKNSIGNSFGNYDLTLDKGTQYQLVYKKNGFVSKIIEISTEDVGDEELKYGLFPVNIDVSLFEDFPGLDVSVMKKPVAKFFYSDYEGDFMYDEDYSAAMSKEVDKVIAAQKKLKKKAYDNFIADADQLFAGKWYEESYLEYQKAQALFPDEKYPRTQMSIISDLLRKQAGLEKNYTTNIQKGDKNFDAKNYKISKSYYQKSLIYKPEEAYPKTRLDEIEKILAGNPALLAKNEDDQSDELTSENITNQTTQVTTENNQTTENVSSGNNENITQKNPVVTDQQLRKDAGITQVNARSQPVDENLKAKEREDFLNTMLDKYRESGDSANVARVFIAKGIDAFKNQQYDLATEHFMRSYDIFDREGMTEDQASVAETMADIYFSMYRYSASADWYARAKGLYDSDGKNEKSAAALLKSADASYQAGDLEQALSKYISATDNAGKGSDLTSLYNSIGVIHFEMENLDQALSYFDKAIASAENAGNVKELAMSLNNIGNVKYEGRDYNAALQYYNRSVMAKNRIDYKAGIAVSLHNIANVYRKTGDYTKALDYYAKAEKFALASGNTDVIYENYGALAEIYAKMNDCGKAVKYYKLYAETKHLITRNTAFEQINESSPYYANLLDRASELDILKDEIKKQRLLAFYESARKQKEIEYLNTQNQLHALRLKNNEDQIRTQRLLIGGAGLGLVLLLLFLISLYRQNKIKKKANRLLAEQNEEINAQKQEIESQRDLLFDQKEKIEHIHLELTDSIRYAKRIQEAVLSSVKTLNETFPDTFILYKPLEIVSGDFYWSVRTENKIVFCVADCTGHGVPGAFMSMLGISFLNEIVLNEKQTQPDAILNFLRESTIRALGQEAITDRYGMTRIRDGMDIALCTINLDTLELQFAGANNSLYLVSGGLALVSGEVNQQPATSNQELIELKGDKMPIGVYEKMEAFTVKKHQLRKGDHLYLFSDGFVDQFGGKDGRKFKNKALKELLVSVASRPIGEQKEIIARTHDEWKGKLPQIDDITLIGLKI